MVGMDRSKISKINAQWLVRIKDPIEEMLVSPDKKVAEGEELVRLKHEDIKSFDVSMVVGSLTTESRQLINQQWTGKAIKKGEVLFQKGGVFGKKVLASEDGEALGLDEFLNFSYKTSESKKYSLFSPVDANVLVVDDQKISLKFSAYELEGQGIVAQKIWGNGNLAKIDDLNAVTYRLAGRIIFVENISKTLIMKAEVVGVAGLVVIGEMGAASDDVAIPILTMDREVYSAAVNKFGIETDYRMLLNSKVGRLLLVVK